MNTRTDARTPDLPNDDDKPATRSNGTKDRLRDRCILITGATGGLGSALARSAASEGATVVLAGRNVKRLEALYDELEATGAPEPAIYPVNLDGATQTDYLELYQTMSSELGRLDGLVHCAAELGTPTHLEYYPVATWTNVMQVNVTSAFLLTRSLLPLMDQTGNASIVFTTDTQVSAYWGAYGVSKSALDAMACILADEIEGRVDDRGYPRVAVNRINPGPMRTSLRQKSFAGELPSESPYPDTKVEAFIELLARTQPETHGKLITL